MVNIYTSYGNSPAICSMFDSSKGSFGNRLDCTVHRASNTARATAETGALGVATYAGCKAINAVSKGKSFMWNNTVNNGLEKLAKSYKNLAKDIAKSVKNTSGVSKLVDKSLAGICNVFKTVCEKMAKTSGRQKLLGLLSVAAFGTLIAIERKHAFKEGQYEQKYNDIAKRQL